MKIVVFGATGQTGKLLVEQALVLGHELTAVTRRLEAIELNRERLKIITGDFKNQNSIDAAIMGQDAVLSAIGAPMSRAKTSIHADSARGILTGMKNTGVNRFICISSGGTNPEHDSNLPFFYEQIFKRLFINIYLDQMEMEKIVMDSRFDWTIVRPAALTNRPATGRCRKAEAYAIQGGNETPRADLADFMLKQLNDPTYVRKAVALAI